MSDSNNIKDGDSPKVTSQITFSEDFINKLLSKLKVGNRRGIHLNALPGRFRSRLDLKNLDYIADGKADNFLEKLFTDPEFIFELNFDGISINKLEEKEKNDLYLLARRLNNISYDNEDQYLEFGIKNFGLGYPLLIRRDVNDPDKVIKAPLLIWKLDIEKSIRKTNSWTIKRDKDSPIIVNELLRNYIISESQIEIEQLSEDILQDDIVDKSEFLEICKNILGQLNVKSADVKFTPRVEICPAREKVETLTTEEAWIQWSGVFGLYKARKESIIKRNEELLEELRKFQDDKLILENFQTSTVSAVETDPSKEELINSLTNSEIKLIQGPPGTGKSQALTAIITNTLENGGRCLVVCEKRTALDVIFKNLEDLGLSDYCALIDDINRDRSGVIRKARSRVDSCTLWRGHYSVDAFQKKYNRFIYLRDSFNKKHASLFSKVLGDKTWKDSIGEFIKSYKKSDFKKISEQLEYSNYVSNDDEFSKLKDVIFEADKLYRNFNISNIPALNKLSDDIFKKAYTRASHDKLKLFIERRIGEFRNLFDILKDISDEDTVVGKYSIIDEQSLSNGLKDYKDILGVIKKALKIIANYEKFTKDSEVETFKIRTFDVLIGLFRKKTKALISKKRQYIEALDEYNNLVRTIGDGSKLKIISVDKDASLVKAIEELKEARKIVDSAIAKLDNLVNILSKIKASNKAQLKFDDIYTKRELLDIASVKKFSSFKNKVVTEIDYFSQLLKEMHEHEPFHKWKYYINFLEPNQLSIINSLINTKNENWMDTFIAWYLYGTLSQHEDKIGALNTSSEELERLSSLYLELQEEQIKKIRLYCDNQLNHYKTKYEQKGGNFNLLYNLRKNRTFSRTNSLRRIIHSEFDLFTSVFSVVMTNPVAADSILPLEQGLFDVVIFDEASQLRIEDTFTSLIRGQYKIIAGDKHQMPPSYYFESISEGMADRMEEEIEMSDEEMDRELASAESLLDYANNLSKKSRSYLDYHYRSKHPALIEFSNVAFYGGNLVPFPETETYRPIEFIQVNGLYRDNVNQREIVEIVRILQEEIHKQSDDTYPSVGIATFNLKQRNEIIDTLNLRSSEDSRFAKILEGIKKSGLFVKNLENIQGDEMDIVIISTTYGKGDGGRFFERFGPVNYAKGYKLLNVLITRARYKVYVCTSIPRTKYMSYDHIIENVTGNNRKGILYAYLAYAEAISNGDEKTTQIILSKLKENSHDPSRIDLSVPQGLVESPFEQEVYEVLREYYAKEQVVPQYRIGGFRIDFLVTPDDKTRIAIECDGKTYHSSREAYAYDMFREEELKKMGFIVYRIWSTKWWHNHQKEIDGMIRFIKSKTHN